MRIQTKLFVLLLAIAVLPLVALSLRGQRATQNLGTAIANRGREAVSGEIELQLQQTIAYSSDILSAQEREVELALRVQASEAERRLAAPPPVGEVPLYRDHAFDRPETWPPGTELALDHVLVSADRAVRAMPVSREHQAFYLVGVGDDATVPAALRDDLRRLGTMDAVYRTLAEASPGLFYWQYVTLKNGIHSVYPGHGGYPENFDPRTRTWYEAAVKTGDLTWVPPQIDASTRRLLLNAAMPIRGPDGAIAGVTGIDVDILARLTALHARLRLGTNAESYIVRLVDAAGEPFRGDPAQGRASLRVVAATTYTDTGASWDAALEETALVSGTPTGIDAMAGDLLAGHAGLRHMPHRGTDAIWVYGSLERLGAALLYIVPAEDVAAIAEAAQGSIWGATMEQVRLAGIASVVLIGLVAFLSAFAARSVTRPLRDLAAAAETLAQGDLDTRVPVTGKDEVGQLAAAFNAMVPELQSHIKVKQELSLAHEVQQKLLPAAPPVIPGYDIAGISIYCDDVGGDYYDFLDLVDELGERRAGVIVGDVTGHGIAAAMTMTSVRALLRSHAGDGRQLLPVMRAVNRHLAADASGGRFVTLVYLVVEPGTRPRTLRWISAGQAPLLFYDPATGQFEELSVHDIPLGVAPEWAFHESERNEWPAQGVLVIGTDGIWETQNPEGRPFGEVNLKNVVRASVALSAREICEAVADRLRSFARGAPQKDDVTLVVLKFT
jgi:sigma-B regulation protein RsbU (phosphoserine phosphatase)